MMALANLAYLKQIRYIIMSVSDWVEMLKLEEWRWPF
jgi:hypothetical protein